jgi:dihydroorotate dehydrogenase electron transfer subunit
MSIGKGTVFEVYLEGYAAARISCPPGLIPGPGQYLLADAPREYSTPLPVPVFPARTAEGGFLAASPFPKLWNPGASLTLRGPLGHGFSLPSTARMVALVVFGETHHRLAALIEPAFTQRAAVSLLCDQLPSGLPNDVEIMSVGSLPEVARWADYIAVDMPLEKVQSISGLFESINITSDAEILLSSAMPCGGRGDCGVCAVRVKRGYKLICKDGPVFDLKHFL